VIIGRLVSRLGQRLVATCVALWAIGIATLIALADAPTDSTWMALKPLPHQGSAAIFALAVDPSNSQVLVSGNSEGSLLRSPNGKS